MKIVKAPFKEKEYVVAERYEIFKPLFDIRVDLVTSKAHIEVLNQMIDSLDIDDEKKIAFRVQMKCLSKYVNESFDIAEGLNTKLH